MAASSNELKVTTPSDLEIVMAREFDAPRDLVFEAHSSCEHMARWWGPRNQEVVDCAIDFRPGGKWRIVHRDPDGDELAFYGEYREIIPPERIVWTFDFDGSPGDAGVETMTFEEHDGITTLSSLSVFDTVEERDGVLQSGMVDGATETLERLDEYLEILKARPRR